MKELIKRAQNDAEKTDNTDQPDGNNPEPSADTGQEQPASDEARESPQQRTGPGPDAGSATHDAGQTDDTSQDTEDLIKSRLKDRKPGATQESAPAKNNSSDNAETQGPAASSEPQQQGQRASDPVRTQNDTADRTATGRTSGQNSAKNDSGQEPRKMQVQVDREQTPQEKAAADRKRQEAINEQREARKTSADDSQDSTDAFVQRHSDKSAEDLARQRYEQMKREKRDEFLRNLEEDEKERKEAQNKANDSEDDHYDPASEGNILH